MNEIEFLNEVKGLDEDGKSKAQVVVGIMDVLKNEMIDTVTSFYGVLDVAIVPDYNSAFELTFSGSGDYEYVQLTGLLDEYFALVSASNDRGEIPPLLTLTIMSVGDIENYLTVVGAMYSYKSKRPYEIADGIHFVAPTENLEFFGLSRIVA
ncbi:hypothetical protein, partial [Pseudobutyrivibrio sp.]